MRTEISEQEMAAIEAPMKALVELVRAIAEPHVLRTYGDAEHLTAEITNVLFQALVAAFADPANVLKAATINIGYFLRHCCTSPEDAAVIFAAAQAWLQQGVDAAQAERAARRFDA